MTEKEAIMEFQNNIDLPYGITVSDEASKIAINTIAKLEKLNQLTDMMRCTFDWGCTDKAWDKYAQAVYAIISENPCFNESEQEFLDYIKENKEDLSK